MTSRQPGANKAARHFFGVVEWFSRLSRITRLTARREFAATLPLAVLMSVMGVQFCGFVGRKALDMPDGLLAALMACNFLGLLLAGPIIGFLHRQRKIVVLTRILIGISIILMTVALTPGADSNGRWGYYLFLAQMFLAQIGVALLITIRTSVWRANYPAQHRGKIVVSIGLVLTCGISGVVMLFTSAMDHLNLPFQAVYFTSGLFGLATAHLFSRIKIRREKSTLRNLSQKDRRQVRLFAGLAVLKKDRRYGRYMSWQMLNGFATLVIEIVLVVILADVLGSNWTEGGAALAALPLFATGISSLIWARAFDRHDIYTIRFYSALAWAAGRLVLMLGVWRASIGIILLSRAISGIAMGGGQLAWRLGHMEFAPADKDPLYMGAHVSLTGLRGLVAPFIGIFLYNHVFPKENVVWLMALTALLQITAALGFRRMRKESTA